MRGKSASELGAAELPMGLLIAAVVASMSVPLVMTAFTDLSVKVTVEALEEEIEDLLGMVQAVMDGGNGSVIEVDLDITHFGSSRVDQVDIGGPPGNGSERFIVSYEVAGHGRDFMSLDPPRPMVSGDGGGLELGEGHYELRLRHIDDGNENVCLVELI